jgi:hypothetical protein
MAVAHAESDARAGKDYGTLRTSEARVQFAGRRTKTDSAAGVDVMGVDSCLFRWLN